MRQLTLGISLRHNRNRNYLLDLARPPRAIKLLKKNVSLCLHFCPDFAFIYKTLPHDNVPYPPPRRLHGMSHMCNTCPRLAGSGFIRMVFWSVSISSRLTARCQALFSQPRFHSRMLLKNEDFNRYTK